MPPLSRQQSNAKNVSPPPKNQPNRLPRQLSSAASLSPTEKPILLPHSDSYHDVLESNSLALLHIPGLTVDYDVVDRMDPNFSVSWLESFLLMGVTSRDTTDPRYRALAKLRRIKKDHGISNLQLVDYLLAASVYSSLLLREAKKATDLEKRRPRRTRSETRSRSCPEYGQFLDNMTEDLSILQTDLRPPPRRRAKSVSPFKRRWKSSHSGRSSTSTSSKFSLTSPRRPLQALSFLPLREAVVDQTASKWENQPMNWASPPPHSLQQPFTLREAPAPVPHRQSCSSPRSSSNASSCMSSSSPGPLLPPQQSLGDAFESARDNQLGNPVVPLLPSRRQRIMRSESAFARLSSNSQQSISSTSKSVLSPAPEPLLPPKQPIEDVNSSTWESELGNSTTPLRSSRRRPLMRSASATVQLSSGSPQSTTAPASALSPTPGPLLLPQQLIDDSNISIGEIELEYLSNCDNSRDWSVNTLKCEHLQLLYHMLRHAESIYGLPLNVASAPRISLTRLTDRAIICRRTGVLNTDIRVASFKAQPFLPAHYVAVDRQINAIVICVRGTANIFDSLTDVAATFDPMSVTHEDLKYGNDVIEGLGHAGVLRSARNLFKAIRKEILGAARDFPSFEILLTGHSLGGATAAVLSSIMRNDPGLPRAKTISIGPCPCLTKELAEECNSHTISLVNGPDIVPRLSLKQALPFFATARYINGLSVAKKALLKAGFRHPVLNWNEIEIHNEKCVKEMMKQFDPPQLYLPGKVFQMIRRDKMDFTDASLGKVLKKSHVEVVPVSRTQFSCIEGYERGMFFAHAPARYKRNLNNALKSLGSSRVRIRSSSVVSSLFSYAGSRRSPSSSLPARSLSNASEKVRTGDMEVWPAPSNET